MELLDHQKESGYPGEYLVARIKGRRSKLIREWDRLLFEPDLRGHLRTSGYGPLMDEHANEGVLTYLQKEYRWAWLQMNSELRNIFSPFFSYFETDTLILCLRHLQTGSPASKIEELLLFSMLSKRTADILKSSRDIAAAVNMLETNSLLPHARYSHEEILLTKELKGLEEKLASGIFEMIIRSDLDDVLREFFIYTADSRNIISACKHIRWGLKSSPYFLNGGSISTDGLSRAVAEKDSDRIERAVQKLTGTRIEDRSVPAIYNLLLIRIDKKLKSAGRTSDTGAILYYLWKCKMEARNLSTILYGKTLSRDRLKTELVY
jgi:vacuolar-type H+-ATPase subunit C/Vma6